MSTSEPAPDPAQSAETRAGCVCADGGRRRRCGRPILRDKYCEYCVRMYPCDHDTALKSDGEADA